MGFVHNTYKQWYVSGILCLGKHWQIERLHLTAFSEPTQHAQTTRTNSGTLGWLGLFTGTPWQLVQHISVVTLIPLYSGLCPVSSSNLTQDSVTVAFSFSPLVSPRDSRPFIVSYIFLACQTISFSLIACCCWQLYWWYFLIVFY